MQTTRDRDPARGTRLKDLRNETGKTQAQIADSLGIALRTYQHYEEGASIPATRVRNLAGALNTTPDVVSGVTVTA